MAFGVRSVHAWALHMFEQTLLLSILVLAAFIAAYSFIEKRWRKKNTELMTSSCFAEKEPEFQVLLIGPSQEASEDLSETLFTMVQYAKCPQGLRITLIEAVPELERESTSILMYKNKAMSRGLFTSSFLDKIRVIQVLEGTPMFTEAAALAPNERRLTLVCSGGLRFQKDWDTSIVDDFQLIPGNAFLYCGSAAGGAGGSTAGGPSGFADMRPAFTAVEWFEKSPIVIAKPLLRQSGPMRVIWADWPLVMKTTDVQKLTGHSFEEAALKLTHLSGRPIFSASRPVAWRQNSWTAIEGYAFYANEFFHGPDRLLGTVRDIASASELITKYGSLSNFSWLMSSVH